MRFPKRINAPPDIRSEMAATLREISYEADGTMLQTTCLPNGIICVVGDRTAFVELALCNAAVLALLVLLYVLLWALS